MATGGITLWPIVPELSCTRCSKPRLNPEVEFCLRGNYRSRVGLGTAKLAMTIHRNESKQILLDPWWFIDSGSFFPIWLWIQTGLRLQCWLTTMVEIEEIHNPSLFNPDFTNDCQG